MLAWVSAKIHASQLLRVPVHPDAITVGNIFLEGKKLGMGNVSKKDLDEWASGEIALRTRNGQP